MHEWGTAHTLHKFKKAQQHSSWSYVHNWI